MNNENKLTDLEATKRKNAEREEKNYYIYDDMIIVSDLDQALEKFEAELQTLGLWEYYYTENSLNMEWVYSKENDHYYLISEELIKMLKVIDKE